MAGKSSKRPNWQSVRLKRETVSRLRSAIASMMRGVEQGKRFRDFDERFPEPTLDWVIGELLREFERHRKVGNDGRITSE